VTSNEHLFSLWGGGGATTVLDVDGGATNADRYGPAEQRAVREDAGDLYDEQRGAEVLARSGTVLVG